MNVEVTSTAPAEVEADTLALVAGGLLVRKLDALFEGRLTRSAADADPIAVVHVGRELRARRIALVATDGLDPEDLRTGAGRVVGGRRGGGPRAGSGVQAAAPAPSRGPSTTPFRWPSPARCRRSWTARSSAATTRAG